MHVARVAFDAFYDISKKAVFPLTARDPEVAHELFVTLCRGMHATGLDRLLESHQTPKGDIEISNAAGFNKNGDIPPQTLQYLGFDRVVVGTVTNDPWEGNPRPRIQRYPSRESLVNWMGLPGIGSAAVADQMDLYGAHGVPITMNIMSTPGKEGDAQLHDLEMTLRHLRDVRHVDRIELNISCPNTHRSSGGMDARNEYQENLSMLLGIVKDHLYGRELWLKVSPDIDEPTARETIEIGRERGVAGYTVGNTTTNYRDLGAAEKPEKGGASGGAVFLQSSIAQSFFRGERVIACGGINSRQKLRECARDGRAEGVQIYTPFVYRGPRLLRELKRP